MSSRSKCFVLSAFLVALAIGAAGNIWYTLTSANAPVALPGGEGGWDPAFAHLYPKGALPGWLSALTGFGLGLMVPALCVLVLLGSWVRWRRAAARAARAEAAAQELLTEGNLGDQTVHGKVAEVDGDKPDAARVVVEQTGHVKDGHVDWRETQRRRTFSPFTLELSSGQRLHVEPNAAAQLVDALDEVEVTGHGRRERRARLTVGESVYVRGALARGHHPAAGYRGNDQLVLRPPRRGRMLLSTHRLHPLFDRRARSARTWIVVMLAQLMLVSWWLHAPYWINVLHGETAAAEVSRKESKRVRSGSDSAGFRWKNAITVSISGTGRTFVEELAVSDYNRLRQGSRIPVVCHPRWLAYAQVGAAPTEEFSQLLLTLGTLVVLLVVFLLARQLNRPWYEWRRVDDTTLGDLPPPPRAS